MTLTKPKDFNQAAFHLQSKLAAMIACWLALFAMSLVFLGPVHADGGTSGMSPLSKKLYVAFMEQPNEIWREDKAFVAQWFETDRSEASLYALKQRFAYSYATENLTIAKARKVIPELAQYHYNDSDAFNLIWQVYYPTADKEVAQKILNYTPDTSFRISDYTKKIGNHALLGSALAQVLVPVLFFWSIAYYILVKPKKIRLSWQTVLLHIGVVEVVVALIGISRNDLMISGSALALAITSCLILRSGGSNEDAVDVPRTD